MGPCESSPTTTFRAGCPTATCGGNSPNALGAMNHGQMEAGVVWQVYLNGRLLPPEDYVLEPEQALVSLKNLDLRPGTELRCRFDWQRQRVLLTADYDALDALARALDPKS